MIVSFDQFLRETNSPQAKRPGRVKTWKEFTTPSPEEKTCIQSIPKSNILTTDQNLEKRKEMITAIGFEPAEFAYERAIGNNDSLYSNFTELIALTKRKVGRIVIREDNKTTGYATGFMVSPSLMLTNWHVFEDKEMATESEVQFFYEYDAQGHPLTPVIFRFDTADFFYSNRELDYCFVAVQPMDVTGKVPLNSIGYLYLDKNIGKIGEVNVEKLNIIHHPQGDYKQISIRENTFVGIEPSRIFYETDTAQGSSGSPVFNDQWQVVGLHHKSIAKMNPDGRDYLDKYDQVIPIVDNKIDITRIVWLKNEGIRISVILDHVLGKYPDNGKVSSLALPPPPESISFSVNENTPVNETKPSTPMSENSNTQNISIQVPVSALNTERSIEISLLAKNAAVGIPATSAVTITDKKHQEEYLLEVAKADKEKNVDFSSCTGYDPNFLGVSVPMPQPSDGLKKQIARLKDKGIELKYFKHSVIFNALTRMPAISVVNVEGDASMRLDNSKRKDDWLRDTRIDTECQLTDKFYSGSNFDKGHMSRFEDANWDDTEARAFLNGIYTCFYTNACPQVENLNRAGGLWGKLEKAILEKGVKKESGKLARMVVMNGPVFNDKKDKIFKGVKIPMEFFKIVLWLDDSEKLKATAFKLSQEMLVDDIKFDESMRIDQESLDINKNVVFKNYQCSITSLIKQTGIDFNGIEKFDTFSKTAQGEEVALASEEAMML